MPLARFGFRRQVLSPILLSRELASQVRLLANMVDAIASYDHRFAGLAARLRHAADVVDERQRRHEAEPHRGAEGPGGDEK